MRTLLLTLLVLASLCVLSTGASAAPPAAGEGLNAVIFMYHRFGEEKYPSTNVTVEQFTSHLEYLEANGFSVWPLEKVVEHLREEKPMPDRTVAITIDDAYRSVYEVAYPMLKERGWPFTVFTSTGPVDRGFSSILNWDELREMSRNGAAIANHGVTHTSLALPEAGETRDEWLERVSGEIQTAQKRIEKEIGRAPMLIAYPYGEFSRDLAILVAELGYVAFGQQSGAAGPYSDPRALPRFPMAEAYSELKDFAVKAKSLALPVRSVRPWDPVLSDGERRPLLELGLATGEGESFGGINCFVSGQGRVEVDWVDKSKGRFNVQAPEPLKGSRGRYNCTSPSGKSGRFYWYSHVWILRD